MESVEFSFLGHRTKQSKENGSVWNNNHLLAFKLWGHL